MCFGSIFWAGLKEVVYSVDILDVESITGYDQGPAPPIQELKKRGLNIVEGVLA